MHERELQAARRRLSARRHRDGKLRLRAVLLSLALFGAFWALVFAQMVSGHDPVLSAKAAAATGGARQKQGARNNPQSQPRPQAAQQPQLAVDPATGAIVEIPASSAPPVPVAPAPAPVTTSVS